MGNVQTPAGWYDDGSGRQRWWDGSAWTDRFAPNAPVPGFYPDPSGQERWWDGVRWAPEPRPPQEPMPSKGKAVLQLIGASVGLVALLGLAFGAFMAMRGSTPNERYEAACVELIAERVGVPEDDVHVTDRGMSRPGEFEVRGVLTEEYSFMCRADSSTESFTQILLLDSTGENVW